MPYDGIPQLLDVFSGGNIPICVLSNKPDEFTVACVGKLLPNWSFSVVRGHREPFPRKPDPAGAIAIAKELDLDPSRIVFVGDTATDMKTALGAGMHPVGVGWGFRPEELAENGAEEIIESPSGLLSILGIF